MIMVIKGYRVGLSEEAMERTGKKEYVDMMTESLSWIGVSPEILREKLTEVYKLVTGR